MKKNYFIIFIICLFAQACSDNDEQMLDEVHLSKNVDTSSRIMGKLPYDHLGCGYDITEGYLSLNAIRHKSVLNIKAYVEASELNAERVKYDASYPELDHEMYYGANSEDYIYSIMKKTGYEFSVAANIPIGGKENTRLSIGANKESLLPFTKGITHSRNGKDKLPSYSYSNKYSFAHSETWKYINKYIIDENPSVFLDEKYLNILFIEDLKNVTDEISAYNFVKMYGTHVLMSFIKGGVYRCDYSASIINYSSWEDKEKSIKGGLEVNLGIIKFGGSGSSSQVEHEKFKQTNHTYSGHVYAVGGGDIAVSGTFAQDNPPIFTTNWGDWTKSVNKENSTIVNIDWDKTYPLCEFVSDPIKKALVAGAIHKYMLDAQIQIEDVVPVYRYFSWNMKTFYFGTESNAQALLNRDWGTNDWTLAAVPFYAYNKPNKNAVPIYRYHSGNMRSYYYGTEPNAQALLNRDWGTNDWTLAATIAFYVYNKSHEYTTPIYRYYSSKTRAYYYGTESNAEALLNRDWGTNDWTFGAAAPFYVFK